MYLFLGAPKELFNKLKSWSRLENFETIKSTVNYLTKDEISLFKKYIPILELNIQACFSGLKRDYQILRLIIRSEKSNDIEKTFNNVSKIISKSLLNILKGIEMAEFKTLSELSGEAFNKARRAMLEFTETNTYFQELPTSEKTRFKEHLETLTDGLQRNERVVKNLLNLLKEETQFYTT